MAGLITGLDAGRISENLARIREELPAGVDVLAAVKYVPLEELETLAEAGVELVGENRAQDLAAKATAYPGVLRWHVIGPHQSRKVKAILPHAEIPTMLNTGGKATEFSAAAVPGLTPGPAERIGGVKTTTSGAEGRKCSATCQSWAPQIGTS